LGQHNFSNRKQIELLQTLNYALHKKHYPQDTCGLIHKKIALLKQSDEQPPPITSTLRLSPQKGIKVNFIRVLNVLFELSFFANVNGTDITKKELFSTIGKVINQDLSNFHNDLSVTKSASNSDMRSALNIFEQMYAKQKEISHK
jgi:hypothetical protein